MKPVILFFILALGINHLNFAQQDSKYYEEPVYENSTLKEGYGSAGLGLGLNYGGLGVKLAYNVADKVNIFSGIGYNFHKAGFNLGMDYDFYTVNRTSFYFSGMAGYNAVSVVEGAPEYTQTFYGVSFGTGLKMESKSRPGNYWQFGILLPMRNQKYRDMLDDIRNDPRIDYFNEPLPILISIGYNAGF